MVSGLYPDEGRCRLHHITSQVIRANFIFDPQLQLQLHVF